MDDKPEETVIAFIPSLVATLLRAERDKGTPLTEAEVLDIRDNAPARAIRPSDLPKLVARRGYEDIDPENCWKEWQDARADLNSPDA